MPESSRAQVSHAAKVFTVLFKIESLSMVSLGFIGKNSLPHAEQTACIASTSIF